MQMHFNNALLVVAENGNKLTVLSSGLTTVLYIP